MSPKHDLPTAPRAAPPKANDFRLRLRAELAAAATSQRPFLDVMARQLHQAVGGYPSEDNRMPVCCKVMRSEMTAADQILDAPPSGLGASLVIRYQLPRPT